MKAFVLLILTTVALQCGSQKPSGDKKGGASENPGQIELKTIGQGTLYGNGEEGIPQQNIIIDNKAEWTNLQEKMNSVNEVTPGFSETNIDFSEFIILAAFDKVQGYGGVSIEITKLSENEKEVKFSTKTHSPGGVATTVMNQAFHIVKIPATKKRILFK